MKPRRLQRPVWQKAVVAGLLLSATTLATTLTMAQIAPQSASDLLPQARAATERHDYAAALTAYGQLLAQRPDDVDLLIEVARVNGFADRNAESVRLYRRALALAPQRRTDLVPSMAWQSLWGGQPDEAARLFAELAAQRAATPGGKRADALDGLAQARQALGDRTGALQAFREAHALAPDDPRLHRRLAMALLSSGDKEQAIAELRVLHQRAPDDRGITSTLANALYVAGQYDEALGIYERLLAQRPDDVELLITVARVNGFADRNAEAASLYRRALGLAPERRADLLPALAWQSLWASQAGEAEPLFAELAAAPGGNRVEALDGLGQARQDRGDQAGAVQAFREAQALAPDNLQLHRRLAMALLWSGDAEQAIAELQALRERAPGDRDIAWALANALNFSGLHRQASAGFLAQSAPVRPGERVDLARAWWWAGYDEKALPLLAEPVDDGGRWLRDYRVWRESARFVYASVDYAEDRDDLVTRALVVGGGWHPQAGATADFQLRRVRLDDPFGTPDGTQFTASYRWRLGEPDDAWGTFWPTVAVKANHFPGWSPVTGAARLTWIPRDRWRVDADAGRELVEAPRTVANRVTVDVLGAGVEHNLDTRWSLVGGGAVLRFDDGTTRVRVNGRVARLVYAAGPRVYVGVEGMAFDRVNDGRPGSDNRGYWSPKRYAEARAYATLVHEARPFDLVARIGYGLARETDGSGYSSTAHPNLWELNLGWDVTPGLRLRLAAGGSGAGMGGVAGGGTGYWRRYLSLSGYLWF
jgi:tetratricopeptide (TPR) repeat protein